MEFIDAVVESAGMVSSGIVVPFVAAQQVHRACLLVGLLMYEVEKTYCMILPSGDVIGRITEYGSSIDGPPPPRLKASGYLQVDQLLEKTVVRNCCKGEDVLSIEVYHREHAVQVNVDLNSEEKAVDPDLLIPPFLMTACSSTNPRGFSFLLKPCFDTKSC